MLYNQLSSVLVCSFWVDGCKDRKNMEYTTKPHLQSLQKDNRKTIILFHLTIPKITSGVMVISVTAQRPAPMYMKCQNGTSNSHFFSFVNFRYARLRLEIIRVFRLFPCEFIEKLYFCSSFAPIRWRLNITFGCVGQKQH